MYRFVLLLGILGLAVWQDLQAYKIDNRLIVFGFIAGAGIRIYAGTFSLFGSLLELTVPIILLFILYLVRVLGAGDIKLFSVISIILGHSLTLQILWGSFLVAAVVAIFYLIKGSVCREPFRVHRIRFTIPILLSYLGVFVYRSVTGGAW